MNEMIPKIISSVSVIIIYLVVAFFGAAFMLLAMNGYNDRAAEAAIQAYFVSQIVFAIICGLLAIGLTWLFQNKFGWNAALSVILSIVVSLFIGVVLLGFGIGIGIGFGDMAFRGRR